ACECERSGGMMLGPVLNLVNGPIVGDALKDPGNRINKLAIEVKDDKKLIEEIYLSILNRLPTKKDVEIGLEALKESAVDHDRLVTEYARRKAAFEAYEKTLPAKQQAWEQSLKTTPVWTVLEIGRASCRE